MSNYPNKHSSDFFFQENVIKWILRIFYACCLLVAVIDFFIHRHIETNIERIPMFYATYGFVACVILVIISKWMRILLIRDENYYDEPENPNEYLKEQQINEIAIAELKEEKN